MKTVIPSEILIHIFQYLPPEELRESISLTCTQWRNVVKCYVLVDDSVKVDSPFNHFFSKLLKDCEHFPAFGYNITNKLHQIIQCCPNLRRLKIVLSGKNFWKTLEETFASDESQLKSQIKILELDFDDEAFLMVQDRKVAIDIKKIINHTTTNLNELVVRNTDRHEREDLVFVPGNFCSGRNCFLTKISILSHCYKMTKACLDYITSGELTALKHLDLYIELIESFDESGEVVGVQESSSGEEAYPWNTLKQFCLSKLEYYSIIFTDENETNIFNFDNCNVNDGRLLKVFLLMYGPFIDDDDDW